MTPVFFPKQSGFRKWLRKNHKAKAELLVGFYKEMTQINRLKKLIKESEAGRKP